jgi:hypothetical protein
MEVPILYYNYRCHIRHYDDPNLRKIIQLHIQVCEEIGNRECLPVEGDLITLAFECKGEEQFFQKDFTNLLKAINFDKQLKKEPCFLQLLQFWKS